jgi:hypothetical protein
MVSVGSGKAGYNPSEGPSGLDSLLNASMILGGMGPVNQLHTLAGKWIASACAPCSGMVFPAVSGIMPAPPARRLLQRLRLEEEKG